MSKQVVDWTALVEWCDTQDVSKSARGDLYAILEKADAQHERIVAGLGVDVASLRECAQDVMDGVGELWYCVSKDGLAQLCLDRDDAEDEARKNNILWPKHSPYYAARIVPSEPCK